MALDSGLFFSSTQGKSACCRASQGELALGSSVQARASGDCSPLARARHLADVGTEPIPAASDRLSL